MNIPSQLARALVAFSVVACLGCALPPAAAADHHPAPWLNGQQPSAAPIAAPWRVKAGDRVLLRCGQRYGPLHIQLEGKGGPPLFVGSDQVCPPGQEPVLDARGSLFWQAVGQQPVRHSARAPGRVTQVFDGELPLPRARYPKQGYLMLPANTAAQAGQLPAAPGAKGWPKEPLQGARVHARTQEWWLEEAQVLDAEGRLQPTLRYPLRPKVGLYFSGKAWMLDEQRAWVYDAVENQAWISGNKTSRLGVSLNQPLLQVTGTGNLKLEGVQLFGAGADALRVHLDGQATVTRTTVRWAAGNGMTFIGLQQVQVQDSTVQQTGLDGIFFAEVRRAEVRDNRVLDAGMHLAPGPALAAINVHRTDAALVQGNLVQRSAYHGIRFAGDARVEGNLVLDSCLLLSDCAGIYTWRRHAEDVRAEAWVTGNVVAGVRGDTSVKLGVNDWFVGIYLDNYSNHVTVSDNLVVDANQGIYLHDAWQVRVHNNVVRAALRPLVNAADPGKLAPERVQLQTVADNDLSNRQTRLVLQRRGGGILERSPDLPWDGSVRLMVIDAGLPAARCANNAKTLPLAIKLRNRAAAVVDCSSNGNR